MSQLKSPPPLDGPPDVYGAGAGHSRDLLAASFKTWMAEGCAYVDDLAKDSAEALDGLGRCKTPFDVLRVEQTWLMARSKSWFDAGVRMLTGALHEPESAAAERADFRLPE